MPYPTGRALAFVLVVLLACCGCTASMGASWITVYGPRDVAALERSTTSVKCNRVDSETLSLLARLPHLRELDLSYSNVRDEHLAMLSRFPTLAWLDVSPCTHLSSSTLGLLAECRKLEWLCARGLDRVRPGSLELLLAQTRLRALDLSGGSSPVEDFITSDRDWNALGDSTSLRILRISGRDRGVTHTVLSILARNSSLIELDVSDAPHLSSDVIGSLADHPSLRCLRLARFAGSIAPLHGASKQALTGAVTRLLRSPRLRILDLSGFNFFDDDTLAELRHNTTLTELYLRNVTSIGPLSWHWLSECKSLEIVDLTNAGGSTQTGLAYIASSVKLRELRVGSFLRGRSSIKGADWQTLKGTRTLRELTITFGDSPDSIAGLMACDQIESLEINFVDDSAMRVRPVPEDIMRGILAVKSLCTVTIWGRDVSAPERLFSGLQSLYFVQWWSPGRAPMRVYRAP